MISDVECATDERVLIVAPTGRDAALACNALKAAGVTAAVSPSLPELCAEIAHGAGALLVAEEALTAEGITALTEALAGEPAWSELPIVVLLGGVGSQAGRSALLRTLEPLPNVTLLERPVGIDGLISTIQSGLRARRRQYQIRDLMSELQRALRVKDEFIAAVSHELRTPLNVILGRTHLLRAQGSDGARAASAVDTIERNAKILWQLVEDLIDVARAASGRFPIAMAPLDVASVVEAAVEPLRATAEAKRIRVTTTISAEPLPAVGDELRLQQVIWNLVWNALKFTPPGGRIDVVVRRIGGHASIDVMDTGVGIDAEVLPRIFEPFRQGTASSSDPHRGLGLGLAIVRHLVELHGGSITAASEGPGRGSRFTVTIPIQSS